MFVIDWPSEQGKSKQIKVCARKMFSAALPLSKGKLGLNMAPSPSFCNKEKEYHAGHNRKSAKTIPKQTSPRQNEITCVEFTLGLSFYRFQWWIKCVRTYQ